MKPALLALAVAVVPQVAFVSAAVSAPAPAAPPVRIGQAVQLGGMQITPLAVVEDSRCPATVSCVWAGRVVLRVGIVAHGTKAVHVLALGKPLRIDRHLVTLETVTPAKTIAGVAPNAYRFTFSVRPAPARLPMMPGVT